MDVVTSIEQEETYGMSDKRYNEGKDFSRIYLSPSTNLPIYLF